MGSSCPPRHAARPALLVEFEVLGQPFRELSPAAARRGLERLTLPPHRVAVLPRFGRRHRHDFGELDGRRLAALKSARAIAIARAPSRTRLSGAAARTRAAARAKASSFGNERHRLSQPRDSVSISIEADERRRIAETRPDRTGIDLQDALVLRQRSFELSAASQCVRPARDARRHWQARMRARRRRNQWPADAHRPPRAARRGHNARRQSPGTGATPPGTPRRRRAGLSGRRARSPTCDAATRASGPERRPS